MKSSSFFVLSLGFCIFPVKADSGIGEKIPKWQHEIREIISDSKIARKNLLEEVTFRAGSQLRSQNPRTLREIQNAVRATDNAPQDSQTTRQKWQLAFEALSRAEKLSDSPFALEQREALEIAAWVMTAPELGVSLNPQLQAKIADGWVLPCLGAAPNDPTQPLSRIRLLWRLGELYLSQKREKDGERCLRALIELAQGVHLNMADGARYKLANILEARGEVDEAVTLLRAISHDATKRGAQKLLSQWKEKHPDASVFDTQQTAS